MFTKFIKAWKKEAEIKARIAKWTTLREELIAMKFRLVEMAEILTDRTYYRAMAAIKHRLARINHLLTMAMAAI